MSWILTHSGKAYDYLQTDPAAIDIKDIAEHLSHQARFLGAAGGYSVGQHCVLMARWFWGRGKGARLAYEALMHDAPEAYVGDMPAPLKRLIGEEYARHHFNARQRIRSKYKGLAFEVPDEVKLADLRILLDERKWLLADSPQPWRSSIENQDPLGIEIDEVWTPSKTRNKFLFWFEWMRAQLGIGRG